MALKKDRMCFLSIRINEHGVFVKTDHTVAHTASLNNFQRIEKIWGMFSAAAAKSLQLCLTLCDPTDGSPPGSPVPGILQGGTLEWAAISFSNV